ncbi:AraC family transcriptional regulator [Phenylobacterium sp.]|uniref:helix-turn-helix transcriptional regulator n=1 Tax=Phenylobacterium sp. TaxID=1871053 RepID=UPI002DF3846B|nr:AraC family transcriptional regulator [Phenylobacterium sp.]
MDPTLAWPATTPPRLKLAGQFPLADRDFATRYLGQTHALHLHAYAGRMQLGDLELELAPGDLTVTPAGLRSAYDLPQPGRHWCVHFHPVEAQGQQIAVPLHLRLGAGAGYAAERLAAIAGRQARAGDPVARAAASVAFQDLLLWCVDRAADRRDPADTVADRVAALVDARFAEPLTAGRLARDVGRSQHFVSQAFRRRFGMTVPRYTLQRRMAHARFLLEATNLPVGTVARRVGVDDPQYFNKLVRRFLGDSPTGMRLRAQALDDVEEAAAKK